MRNLSEKIISQYLDEKILDKNGDAIKYWNI